MTELTDGERIRKRAADAATAVERLKASLALNGTQDPVAIAYVRRLLEASAWIDEYTEHDRQSIEPDPSYLGPLRGMVDPGYSASH